VPYVTRGWRAGLTAAAAATLAVGVLTAAAAAQPSMGQLGTGQSGTARAGTARAGMARAGMARAGMARAGMARAGIADTHPGWATASARTSSQLVTSRTVSARVYLAGQDPAGLASYATSVATPGNALYGHYLTTGQVMARYGPTQAQVSAVSSWLTGAGLSVTAVKNEIGGYVAVRGSVQAAAHAFGVTFGTFRDRTAGPTARLSKPRARPQAWPARC